MDNFIKNKEATTINPIVKQCQKDKKCAKMILYTPLVTGGNIPNNVKTQIYAQYVRNYNK
jgi:hypothetical protein